MRHEQWDFESADRSGNGIEPARAGQQPVAVAHLHCVATGRGAGRDAAADGARGRLASGVGRAGHGDGQRHIDSRSLAAGNAGREYRPRGRTVHWFRAVTAARSGWHHRRRRSCAGAAAAARTCWIVVGAGGLGHGVDRFHSADWPGQSHFTGLRLSDSGKWHLPVRSAAHPARCLCWWRRASSSTSRWGCSSSASSWIASSGLSIRSTPENSPRCGNERTPPHHCAPVGAALAALWPSDRTRPWLLPAVGLVHSAGVLAVLESADGCAGRMVGLRSPGAGGVAGGVVVVPRLCRLWGVPTFG